VIIINFKINCMKIFIFLSLLLIFSNSNAQIRERKKQSKAKHKIENDVRFNNLPIKNEVQVGSSLCWASCMKMVINFISKDKVELSTVVNQLQGTTDSLPVKCDIENFASRTGKWNKAIESVIDDESEVGFSNIQEYDRIFSALGYSSNEECDSIPWTEVIRQIDSKRPFLLNIQDGSENEIISSHVILVKGYFQSRKNRFIIVNDPWGACSGQKYMLDYNLLCSTNLNKPVKILKTIYNIHKKWSPFSLNLKYPPASDINDPKESYLMRFYSVKETEDRFNERLSEILRCLPDTSCINKISESYKTAYNDPRIIVGENLLNKIKTIDVFFISNIKEITDSLKNKDISEFYQKNLVCKDIIFKEDNIVVRVQKINNEWKIMKISNDFYPKQNFNNLNSYIIYPKLNQAFFRINKIYDSQKNDFLIPQFQVSKYLNSDKILNPNIGELKAQLRLNKFQDDAPANKIINDTIKDFKNLKKQLNKEEYNKLIENVKKIN
jgi:Peptidase_C39 like family